MLKRVELSCKEAITEAIRARIRKRIQLKKPLMYKNDVQTKIDIVDNEIKYLRYLKSCK